MIALFLILWLHNHPEDDIEIDILDPWVYRFLMVFCVLWILVMLFCITSMLGVEYW